MCAAIILSTRARCLENWLGGLDKVYQMHKRVGKWAFLILLFHPLFLALDRLPRVRAFLGAMWFRRPAGDLYAWGQNVGVAALLLFAVLIALTLWVKLRYHVWKRTHEWFGLVVPMVILHVALVDADVAKYPLLRIWLYGLLVLAVASFIYIRFLYRILGPHYEYVVSSVEKAGEIVHAVFAPLNAKMDFKPSQFVYLVIHKEGITPEPHPYSIACGYNLGAEFKLGIKQVGDHTRTLDLLEAGDRATVYGPYGHFSEKFLSAQRDCVFVGGGIGITPFVGMWHVALHSEDRYDRQDVPERLTRLHPEIIKTWQSPLVSLFYVCHTEGEASFDRDIRQEVIMSHFHGFPAFERRGHHYELYVSSRQGRISAQYIDSQTAGGARDRYVFLCGPSPMVDSLINQFETLGLSRRRIVVEDFNLV
jgi:predicted ferric reductase